MKNSIEKFTVSRFDFLISDVPESEKIKIVDLYPIGKVTVPTSMIKYSKTDVQTKKGLSKIMIINFLKGTNSEGMSYEYSVEKTKYDANGDKYILNYKITGDKLFEKLVNLQVKGFEKRIKDENGNLTDKKEIVKINFGIVDSIYSPTLDESNSININDLFKDVVFDQVGEKNLKDNKQEFVNDLKKELDSKENKESKDQENFEM